MKGLRICLLAALLIGATPVLTAAPLGINPATAGNPVQLYGKQIRFDVNRNGSKVGFHSVSFDQSGLTLAVRSQFELEINFLFISAFHYRYHSREIWENGNLVSLASRVDDDGDAFVIEAYQKERGLQISGPGGEVTSPGPLYPTTHWNAAVIRQNEVLNTLTGQINKVQILPLSRELVATERGPIMATRYAYRGDLDTEVWYDEAGRWVKMKFRGRDGSSIEYVCRLCQGFEDGNAEHAG